MQTNVHFGTGDCAIATGYAGNKNLKSWLTLDAAHPAGATAPAIGAVSLPNAAPGANNLILNFTAGVATFNMSSTDVGKYGLNLRDDTSGFIVDQNNNPLTINGSSNTCWEWPPPAAGVGAADVGSTGTVADGRMPPG